MACGTLIDLGTGIIIIGSLSIYPHTVNGSILLPSGVVILARDDYEAYYNGSLTFILGETE